MNVSQIYDTDDEVVDLEHQGRAGQLAIGPRQ